jgi:hypothetical protein
MPDWPCSLHGIELQETVLGWTMPALTNIANLNASATFAARFNLRSSSGKPHRIPCPLQRKAPTTLCVSQIAKLPQLFLRRIFPFMPRRGALPSPPAPQWKPSRMQPIRALDSLYRQKKRTRHQPLSRDL